MEEGSTFVEFTGTSSNPWTRAEVETKAKQFTEIWDGGLGGGHIVARHVERVRKIMPAVQ